MRELSRKKQGAEDRCTESAVLTVDLSEMSKWNRPAKTEKSRSRDKERTWMKTRFTSPFGRNTDSLHLCNYSKNTRGFALWFSNKKRVSKKETQAEREADGGRSLPPPIRAKKLWIYQHVFASVTWERRLNIHGWGRNCQMNVWLPLEDETQSQWVI